MSSMRARKLFVYEKAWIVASTLMSLTLRVAG